MSTSMSPDGASPPEAPCRPGPDPYAWMRDSSDPQMLAYLAAERAYYERQTAHTAELRDALTEQMSARLAPADESVGWRLGGFHYFTRTLPGLNYSQFCRRPWPAQPPPGPPALSGAAPGRAASRDGAAGDGAPGDGAPADVVPGQAAPGREAPGGPAGAVEVLLDQNELLADPACTAGYVELGVCEVSPDGHLLAYSVDFDGDEVYQLRVRDLRTGNELPGRVERSYYGLAWTADSRSVYYTVTDQLYRPWQVWRHDIGTEADRDVLVFAEEDERFEVTVRASRSGAFVFIESESRDTTETRVLPADGTGTQPSVLKERKKGIEYRADHADGPDGGEFYLVTNEGATEFRVLRGPVRAAGSRRWTQAVPPADDRRIVACDVFASYLVVTERLAAATRLLVIHRPTGAQHLVTAPGPEVALELEENREYHADAVTVCTESLVSPPQWHEVSLADGTWTLRKTQPVPGYRPGDYTTQRITATAPDGTPVPVTIAYRRGLHPDGTAPCLLYGYGAYESCLWPEFSLPVASLLDRGYVYAIAHVRGGGEGGRRWWLDGRLDRKRNTFTDFIAAAGALEAAGWAAGGSIVARGMSAGGLLAGAVLSIAPERWKAVVAEVPFVDCVTTMLDPGIPLTIAEWDEWGDPRDPVMRDYIASYSPYDNVPAGPRPDLLVTGSLHDPRVLVHEPAKWVARMRATPGGGRLLLRPELGAGAHVGPAGRYDKLRYEAEILAFILDSAGEGVIRG